MKPINYIGLNLSKSNINGKSFYSLCKVLSSNFQLKNIDLDFSHNNIDNKGISGVFSLIDGCRSIQHLKVNLKDNKLNDNGFIEFMGSLGGFSKN